MLILVFGGSGSGKSAYAEKRARELAGEHGRKYYLATMAVRDAEMEKKVARHRRIRAADGWETLEYPVDVQMAAGAFLPGAEKSAVVLLEDLGNLAANEMFRSETMYSAEETCLSITAGIQILTDKVKDLIVVSNDVFRDGNLYDEGTMEYIRALGMIHRKLAEEAAEVTEVAVGIPIQLK